LRNRVFEPGLSHKILKDVSPAKENKLSGDVACRHGGAEHPGRAFTYNNHKPLLQSDMLLLLDNKAVIACPVLFCGATRTLWGSGALRPQLTVQGGALALKNATKPS
jgi:hypothetical protein